MLEAKGDIFKTDCDAVCITTNGFIKYNGDAVMGKGCALQATKIIEGLATILGASLLVDGNSVIPLLTKNSTVLVSFPVKDIAELAALDKSNIVTHMRNKFSIGHKVPGWACVARTDIIVRSAHELVKLADELGWKHVVLPRPGCGAGELVWENVRYLIEPILDDRFTCMTF